MMVSLRLQAWLCGVTKADVTHYCHQDLPLRVSQINDSMIPLRNMSDAHVLSLM